MEFVAYHNRTAQEHQTKFNELFPTGYRLISLSVYQPNNPLYAAVWVRRSGPDWSAVHGLSAAQYSTAFNQAAAAGYHATILSAAGTIANPVVAGVFEKRPGPVPRFKLGLTSGVAGDPGTIEHWDQQAHNNGWIMTCGSAYGAPGTRAFAGLWRENTERVPWSAEGILDDHAVYQQRFVAQTSGYARLAYAAVSDDEQYLSIFRDDQIGPGVARHGLTSAGYQTELDRLVPLGYYPVSVQGGGSGAGVRFVVIFARQESVLSRQWNVTGVGTAAPVDAVMQDLLATSGVRHASLAVVDNTRLVFAKGYTWAEPGYPIALPTTLFRQASVSKVFAAVAAFQLIDEGKLRLTDTVQSILGLKTPTGSSPDPTFTTTTVQDLLLHTSLLQPDFAELDASVAQAFSEPLPITEAQLASYKSGEAPRATPAEYNNWGYALLGMVIAHLRGATSFFGAIRQSILEPLQMTRTRLATSLVSASFADESRYHRSSEGALMLGIGRSMMTKDQPLVADLYGNLCLERGAAAGGLSAATVDVARLVAAFNLNRANPMLSRSAVTAMLNQARQHQLAPSLRAGNGFDGVTLANGIFSCFKGGLLATSQNAVNFNLDGVGFVVNYNGLRDAALFQTGWPKLRAAVEGFPWSTHVNHFPHFGMPAF